MAQSINDIKIQLADLERRRATLYHRIKSVASHSRKQEALLNTFLHPYFDDNATQLSQALLDKPITGLAGWADPRWQGWDAVTEASTLDTFIRSGGMADNYGSTQNEIPALIPFIGQNKTIILVTDGNNSTVGASLLRSLVIRTSLMLPHQTRYTLLDPSGNGIAFPMRRYLPQVRENSGDTWRDLTDVTKEIQRIIETYLDAGTKSFDQVPYEMRINERFQFVFAADFPNQYDRRSIEILFSIANTGPVAGVYTFIHYNKSHPLPNDIKLENIRNAAIIEIPTRETCVKPFLRFIPDAEPPADLQSSLFEKLAAAKPPERAIEWNTAVGIPPSEWWRGNASRVIETPIGLRGGDKQLNIWFGVNNQGQPCAHGMLGAMTGAGKSNFYHVLINGLAVRYSPQELRLYLIDGKDGVEFQPYRKLPHAEVVSLRSSPELSRSVLAELVTEKERRNKIFAQCGVNDYPTYRAKGSPAGTLPRILLLVDEYQELFEGDKEGVASNYLMQISQQGRSVGIHMLLASQKYEAVGMIHSQHIFANIHLLLAMKMKAEDIQSLTQFGRRGKQLLHTCDLPGKIVLNDQAGDDNANMTGKVAYLPLDQLNDLLDDLTTWSQKLPPDGLPQRIIFNGKTQPALLDNPAFRHLYNRSNWPSMAEMEQFARADIVEGGLGLVDWFYAEHPYVMWMGQEFNVRGQARLVVRRRIGENVVVLGSNNPSRYGMLAGMLAGLSMNASPKDLRFIILDRSISGAQWNGVLEGVFENVLLPGGFQAEFSRSASQSEVFLNDLVGELDRRRNLPEDEIHNQPAVFALFTDLDNIEALRRKMDTYGGMADSNQGEKLRRLYMEGPALGIHVILSFSGMRALASVMDERRGLHSFRHRVAFQMSEDESFSFTGGRRAAQLQDDGPTPVCALYVDLESDRNVRFKPYTCDPSLTNPGDAITEQLPKVGQALKVRR